MSRNDLDIIKDGLNARILDVCQRLFPNGHKAGGRFTCNHPADAARQTPELHVMLSGRVGGWTDFRSGDKGDVLKLIQLAQGVDLKTALVWARDFLGMQKMSRADYERGRIDIKARQEKADAEALAERSRKIKSARDLFQSANNWPGAKLHAEAYFAARGVPLDGLTDFAVENFRFNSGTEYWTKARWQKDRDGRMHRLTDGPEYPAIHSIMRQANGSPTACHVTFLDPVLPKKAPETPAKLMKGVSGGAVIEITRGMSGLPFYQCDVPSDVIIGEGLETVMSFGAIVPECRLWAGGSLSGVASAPVHLPCVGRIFFARDNNDGNPQAQKAFDKAYAALAASGKPIEVMASHLGDDFNNLQTGKE